MSFLMIDFLNTAANENHVKLKKRFYQKAGLK